MSKIGKFCTHHSIENWMLNSQLFLLDHWNWWGKMQNLPLGYPLLLHHKIPRGKKTFVMLLEGTHVAIPSEFVSCANFLPSLQYSFDWTNSIIISKFRFLCLCNRKSLLTDSGPPKNFSFESLNFTRNSYFCIYVI